MPTVRLVPQEEARRTRTPKAPGPRALRMRTFETYVQPLLDHPDQALIVENIEEAPQTFILTLRATLRRKGIAATVRKIRNRNEVRAWIDPAA